MTYSTKLLDDSNEYRTLRIEDGDKVREYTDGGEPEDQTFWRDWRWVLDELQLAYQAGLRDGKAAELERHPEDLVCTACRDFDLGDTEDEGEKSYGTDIQDDGDGPYCRDCGENWHVVKVEP